MENNNMRVCVLDKKQYKYCSSCRDDVHKPTWHKLYCSENCKNIFTALNNFNFGLITKEEAKEALSKCDLTIELNDHYRGEIEALMAEPKKKKEPVVAPESEAKTME